MTTTTIHFPFLYYESVIVCHGNKWHIQIIAVAFLNNNNKNCGEELTCCRDAPPSLFNYYLSTLKIPLKKLIIFS